MGTVQSGAIAVKHRTSRYWEIDAARGIVVVLMVFFHLMWDLSYFQVTDVDILSAPWQTFARGIGTTFTLLMGLSLTIRATREAGEPPARWRPFLQRGTRIFGFGMVVTLVTYLAIGKGFVVFGILHMQGVALMLAYPFIRARTWVTGVAALVVIVAGVYLNRLSAPFPWLIWLGVPEQGRAMVDYYPLLPWSGAALLGVVLGRTCYPRGLRSFRLPPLGDAGPVRLLCSLGRHSLTIYLVHQPVLLGLLIALGLGSL